MTTFLRRSGPVWIAALVLLAGCSGTGQCRPHTDYMTSQPTAPLRAPSGLAVPEQDLTRVPVPAGPRQPVTRTDSGRCLMEPPSFYATNPSRLDEDPAYAQTVVLDTEAFTTEVETLAGTPDGAGGAGALVGASRVTLEIAEFLSAWAETWSRRDAEAWFAFYAPNYAPAGYDDNADWRTTQAERFTIPAVTIVVYETLEVEVQPGGEVRAQFVQRFGEAPNTRSVEKAMLLTPGGPRGWTIIAEQITDVL
jgi:hypothetical protein